MEFQDAAVLRMLIVLVLLMMAGSSETEGCIGQKECSSANSSNSNNTSKDYCYTARIRSTVLQGLPFGGVPTVLALDFMCFLVRITSLQFSVVVHL